MNRTKIEYLDYTWTPLVGCDTFDCAVQKKCWARAQAKRQKHRCEECYKFVPHVHWERFEQPLKIRKPSRVGTVFMGDFYTEGVAEWVRMTLYMVMEKACWHTFIILTKQPQNIDLDEVPPKNVQIGVSINIKQDLMRLELLRDIEISCRILSAEPLYEDLGTIDLEGIGWMIIGAQTRPALMPESQWVQSLIDQARENHIPLFLKNNLNWTEKIQEFPRMGGRF